MWSWDAGQIYCVLWTLVSLDHSRLQTAVLILCAWCGDSPRLMKLTVPWSRFKSSLFIISRLSDCVPTFSIAVFDSSVCNITHLTCLWETTWITFASCRANPMIWWIGYKANPVDLTFAKNQTNITYSSSQLGLHHYIYAIQKHLDIDKSYEIS